MELIYSNYLEFRGGPAYVNCLNKVGGDFKVGLLYICIKVIYKSSIN